MLTGEQILELQTLVRKVPVTDHVIQYTLALVRQTRVGEPGVPKFVKRLAALGRRPAGGAEPRSSAARPAPCSTAASHVHDRGHPGAGLPGAAAPHPDQLHRRLRGHHDRHGHQEAARGDAEQGRRPDPRRAVQEDLRVVSDVRDGSQVHDVPSDPRDRRGSTNRTNTETLRWPCRRQRRRPAAVPRTPRRSPRISRLDLRARQVVEGFISGMHKSPFFGQSVEFVQHREYIPGDDIRHLDWKVWSQDRQVLHQAVRGGDQPARLRSSSTSASRCTTADGTAAGPEQVRLRLHRRRVPGVPDRPAAGLVRADHVRRGRAAGHPAAQLSRRTWTPSSRRCTSASRARRRTS